MGHKQMTYANLVRPEGCNVIRSMHPIGIHSELFLQAFECLGIQGSSKNEHFCLELVHSLVKIQADENGLAFSLRAVASPATVAFSSLPSALSVTSIDAPQICVKETYCGLHRCCCSERGAYGLLRYSTPTSSRTHVKGNARPGPLMGRLAKG